MSEQSPKQQRAIRLYELANQYASTSNAQTSEAKKVLQEYKEQKERLENWKRIMSMEPINLFTFFFVAVAIAEFIFSYEIYREMVPKAPWVMAIAFFGVGIVLSEWIVYQVSKNKRQLLLYEDKRNPLNKGKIEEDLYASIKKKALFRFIAGIIGSLILLYVIYSFSIDRAKLEISAGERTSPVGVRDWLPLILYIFEIIFGVYIFYLMKKSYLSLRTGRLKKKFENLIISVKSNTAKSVKYYQEAEVEDYDPIKMAVSDDINVVFFRNFNKSIENKEDYIIIPEKKEDYFKVKLTDIEGNPISRHITVITKYKLTDAGMSDENGMCTITLETYPNDAVQFIFIRKASNSKEYHEIIETYDLNKDEVYTLKIEG